MFMILNNNVNFYNFIGVMILGILIMSLKNSTKDERYKVLGITHLQNKFKNSEIIMDMTKE